MIQFAIFVFTFVVFLNRNEIHETKKKQKYEKQK